MKKFEKADFEETNILRRWLCAGRNLGGMIVSNIDDARTNRVLYSKKLHTNDEEYSEAAEAWNTRKPMERIVQQLENKKGGAE